MLDTFWIKLTQLEKTGSIGRFFISLINPPIKFRFRNYKSITFFVTFTFLLFYSAVRLRPTKEINRKEINSQTTQKCLNKLFLKKNHDEL